jgi:hypothetical protein
LSDVQLDREQDELRREIRRLQQELYDAGFLLGRSAARLLLVKEQIRSSPVPAPLRLDAALCEELEADIRAWAAEHPTPPPDAADITGNGQWSTGAPR